MEQGAALGEAAAASVEELGEPDSFERDTEVTVDDTQVEDQELQTTTVSSRQLSGLKCIDTRSGEEACKEKLLQLLLELETMEPAEGEHIYQLLQEHHEAFCIYDNERGETDVLQFSIDTGDSPPQKLPARRMPIVVQ